MSNDDIHFKIEDIMSNYWYSRGLMVAGMLLAMHCPFPMILLPVALVVDLFYQNPIIPMNVGRPQEAIAKLVMWLTIQYRQIFSKDIQKKTE